MLKTRRRVVHRVRRTRRKQGAGFMDALRSAHNWIKSNKIVSGVSGLLSKVGVPYAGAINTASSALCYGQDSKALCETSYRQTKTINHEDVSVEA